MIKKYLFYLLRWQLSTPILAFVIWWLSDYNGLVATITANLIGGLIFFWVDKLIFKGKTIFTMWESRNDIECVDCGTKCVGYRLVKTDNYDRSSDEKPQFRCPTCSAAKTEELRQRGVHI